MGVKKLLINTLLYAAVALGVGAIMLGLVNSARIHQESTPLQAVSSRPPPLPAHEPVSINTPGITRGSRPTGPETRPAYTTKNGVPVFTNDSVGEATGSKGDWDVYRKLQQTCAYWTSRFQAGGSEGSRVHMNQACRDAAAYARKDLGIDPGAVNYAPYRPNTRPQRTLASTGTSSYTRNNSNWQCASWKREREQVQHALRAGYREPKGNRLRARKRELSDLIRENC